MAETSFLPFNVQDELDSCSDDTNRNSYIHLHAINRTMDFDSESRIGSVGEKDETYPPVSPAFADSTAV